MRFGKVDVPQELVDARREGSLVVFAGAGVSMGPPSNLPGFEGLVQHVARGTAVEQEEHEPFDRFLGRLHRSGEGVDVHSIVKDRIDGPGSEPTPLHFELLKLFGEPSNVRLVTTNFDRHFTTAADELFDASVSHFYAPALPLGNDFTGVVYLHGSVRQEASRLALTDEDFSRAYLTEGWARRFLQRLFAEHHVLFVGYSHGDAIMKYLARGIPPTADRGRYALDKGWEDEDEDEEPTNWKYFGVAPIYYPRAEGDDPFAELPRALKRWNQYAARSARERAEDVRRWVSQEPPTLDVEAKGQLLDTLDTPEGVRYFMRHATSPSWLYWLLSEGVLDALFGSGPVEEREQVLADWIGIQFVRQHPDYALALVGPRSKRLNSVLWQSIASGLWRNQETEELPPAKVAEWVQCLLTAPPASMRNLELLMGNRLRPSDWESAVLLFEHFSQPTAEIRQGFRFNPEEPTDTEPEIRYDVALRGEGYHLRQCWEDVLHPQIKRVAGEVAETVTANLRALHRHFRSTDRTLQDGDDWISFGRSAIEPHDQDDLFRNEAIHVFIDVARDVIEWLIEHRSEHGQSIIEKWATSQVPLLERLAIHGMAENPHMGADDKLEWLLGHDWLYTRRVKHEVFQLIAVAYSGAEEDTRETVLNEAWRKWPAEDVEDRRFKAYEVYNLIHWLAVHAEESALAQQRLDQIKVEYPNFKPREHPDLDSWGVEVRDVERSDRSEILLHRPPGEQMERILAALGRDRHRVEDEIGPRDVRGAVSKEFGWGFALSRELAAEDVWEEARWRPVWKGLVEAPMDEEEWGQLLNFIRNHPPLHSHSDSVARLLEQRIKPDGGDLPYSQLDKAEEIADLAFESSRDVPFTVSGNVDLATRLLNHSGATITMFYIYALWERLENQDEARHLPGAYRDRFDRIIEAEHRAAQAGQMIMGARFNFLYQTDQEWAQERLLPMFVWQDGSRARQLWAGMLFMGRVNPELIPEMRNASRSMFPHLSNESEEFRRRFAGRMVKWAVSEVVDPLEDEWLSAYMANVSESDRVHWAQHMSSLLRRSDPETTERMWQDWICQYWELRLEGRPEPLTPAEAGHMVSWLPQLKPVFSEAVPLVCRGPRPEFERDMIYYSIREEELDSEFPDLTTQLLIFLLNDREGFQPYLCRYIDDVLKAIANAEDCSPENFEELVDRAVALNCIDTDRADSLLERC